MLEGIYQNDIRYNDLMTITEVAKLLSCSVDHVRRIPGDQLAIHRVGKENLYFRADVIRYVRVHCRVGPRPGLDDLL